MVDKGNYFVINRARQYGKTTTLATLAEYLKDEYTVVFIDFQTIGSAMYENEDSFSRAFTACFLDELQSLHLSEKEAVRDLINRLFL